MLGITKHTLSFSLDTDTKSFPPLDYRLSTRVGLQSAQTYTSAASAESSHVLACWLLVHVLLHEGS